MMQKKNEYFWHFFVLILRYHHMDQVEIVKQSSTVKSCLRPRVKMCIRIYNKAEAAASLNYCMCPYLINIYTILELTIAQFHILDNDGNVKELLTKLNIQEVVP